MTTALSESSILAMSMQAMPGVYAVLAGSGVSTSAGIPTGWGVTTDLVRRLAAAEFPDDRTELDEATADPEGWWVGHHGGELGYASLLEAVAPSAAVRQGLLASYFTATDQDREVGQKVPGPAHRAIARLVRRGSVRVVLTTNFDRLLEEALEAEGVFAQVISRPEAVRGMAPLAHSAATLIKLHGDYMDLGSRNTPDELSSYPDEWNRLLSQVFDEYGLVISGWSAEYDVALRRAISESPNRRYPLYWDSRSGAGSAAQSLLRDRGGRVISSSGADEMFSDLLLSLESLDLLTEPPLSTAMAIARLKRSLLDPARRIELEDLVMGYAAAVASRVADQPLGATPSGEYLEALWADYVAATTPLLHLIEEGTWLDTEGIHDRLWIDVLQRLVDVGSAPVSSWVDPLRETRLLPALLVLATCGIVASRRGRESLFLEMATEVTGNFPGGLPLRSPAGQLLHPAFVMRDWAALLPRWNGGRPRYPWSRLLTAAVRPIFTDRIPASEFDHAFHGFEYRLGLIQERQQDSPAPYRALAGEYVGDHGWSWENRELPLAELDFRRLASKRSDWPWYDFLGGAETFDSALTTHREILLRHRRDAH